MNILTNYERGWLEALIDGEGCLEVRAEKTKNGERYYCRLKIGNTCRPLMEKAKEICGEGQISVYVRPHPRRVSYTFSLSHRALRRILPQLSLIVKETQQDCVLKALKLLEHNPRRARRSIKKRTVLTNLAKICKSANNGEVRRANV